MRNDHLIFRNTQKENKKLKLLSLIRAKTLIASLAPCTMGAAIYGKNGSLLLYFFALTYSVLIQITTNIANDYFDYKKGSDTPKRIGPLRSLQRQEISIANVRAILVALSCCSLCYSAVFFYEYGFFSGMLSLLCLALAFLYTGTSYALAHTGVSDIFSFIFFGIVATTGSYFIQAKMVTTLVAFYSIIPGCLATSLLVANNLRDYDEDKNTGKKTLVVRFGKNFGRAEWLVLSLIPYGVLYAISLSFPTISLLPFIALPLTIYTSIKLFTHSQHVFLLPFSALIYCIFFSLSLLGYVWIM